MLGLNQQIDNKNFDKDVLLKLRKTGEWVNLKPRVHITKGKVTPFNSNPVDVIYRPATQEEFAAFMKGNGWAKRIGTLNAQQAARNKKMYDEAVKQYAELTAKGNKIAQGSENK